MTKLHWLDDTFDDHRRAKAGAEPKKQHLAALIASQCLHCRVVDDFHGDTECAGEIKPDPAAAQIPWFSYWPPAQHGPRITNRDDIIGPAIGDLLNAGDHLLRRHLASGR